MRPLHYYSMGLRALVGYRPDTSDEEVIRNILIDRTEYNLFVGVNPRVIFDIGANIGAASLLFANSYPNALVFAFEPEAENFEVLVDNTKTYQNIKCFNFAVGAESCRRTLYTSDDINNLGGYSFHKEGITPESKQEVHAVSINEFMDRERINKIDLLKVDTEGCEPEIICALKSRLPPLIMGEMHGTPADFSMFDLLSSTHDLEITKKLGCRVYPFYAKVK